MGPWHLKPIYPMNLQIQKEKGSYLRTEPWGTPTYSGQVNWEKPVKETEGPGSEVGESGKSDGGLKEKEFQEKDAKKRKSFKKKENSTMSYTASRQIEN